MKIYLACSKALASNFDDSMKFCTSKSKAEEFAHNLELSNDIEYTVEEFNTSDEEDIIWPEFYYIEADYDKSIGKIKEITHSRPLYNTLLEFIKLEYHFSAIYTMKAYVKVPKDSDNIFKDIISKLETKIHDYLETHNTAGMYDIDIM